jgi:pyruvate kinase
LKKTKILCTVGPSSLLKHTIEEMVKAGMNGVRVNTAYGDFSQYDNIIDKVREIADIPLVFDIKGPEIRLKVAQARSIDKGEVIEVGFNGEAISFNHDFYDQMDIDDILYIDNGKIRAQVVKKNSRMLQLIFLNGGLVDDGKGVNIPNKQLATPTFRKEDLEIIKFAKERDVEYFALSFVRNVDDLKNFKSLLDGFEGGLIAKIENSEGVANFNEILEGADGIMVARGDLGVEIEPQKVPLVQKSIIRKCNQSGKPVITATEMLESMINQPNPTRAEVSDVANAILDGTDAVMLSGETAMGKYPVEAVKMMSKIALETEKATKSQVEDGLFINISDAISKAIQRICQNMPVDKVITLTRSGYTAKMIARLKIQQPIIAVTPTQKTKRRLELVFGVLPVQLDYQNEKDRIYAVANKLRSMNFINDEETVLFTSAVRTTLEHASNSIEIHRLKDLIFTPQQPSSLAE